MLERIIKMGLASMLLALLITVGSLSLLGTGRYNNTFASAQAVPAQQTSNNSAAPVLTSNNAQAAQPQAQAQAPAAGGLLDARTAVRRTGPAVVTVINSMQAQTRGNGSGRFGTPNGNGSQAPSATASGSGVIIDSNGDIVTNNHVVEGESSLQVVFANGKTATAKVVGTDAFSDLAVIHVDGTMPAVATLGNSDTLEPGQPVVAIGSPLGDYQNTVTAGIVSGLHRGIQDSGSPSLRDLIQTDAAINHGNSGGPLLDIDGNVIGINVAVVRTSGLGGDVAEGLGFAIPSNTVRQVTDQLLKGGTITRPFLGISYQEITPQIASLYNLSRSKGILVSEVQAGSPADKAGIKANSIVTKFDGVELDSNNTLLQLLMKHKVGDTVKLTVIADGSTVEKDYNVVLAPRPSGQ